MTEPEAWREYTEELREINRTLNHGTQVLHDYIATLKAELDAARQDRARLEAMERHIWSAQRLNRGGWALVAGAQWVEGRTLREAIDTAMARKEEGA